MIEAIAGGTELFLFNWEKTVAQKKVIKKLDNKNLYLMLKYLLAKDKSKKVMT